ncbi:hypothetical protein PF003_g16053 [Phytophthora fragariae]|nr:hypothetical protein PF003_g16053 [Phytophthora fragariae]
MWEAVALEYNSRRSRNWLERDYDSLRRKFQNLYGKPKPTGNNGEIPPKLRPIALAHEIQWAIEKKGGAHTSHDGFDRGEDDAHLLRDVDVALNPTEGDEPAAGADTGEEDRPLNSASEDEAEEEEESQAFSEDFTQFAQGSPRESQQGSSTARGTIITRMGNFDASLGSEVWSEDEDASASQDAAPNGDIEGGSTADDRGGAPPDEVEGREQEPAVSPNTAVPADAVGLGVVTTSSRTRLTLGTAPSPRTTIAKAKSAGRPKGAKSPSVAPRPTYASPDGPPLSRDPTRAVEDAQEMSRNKKKNTASNRLGGCDLRVMRDNLDELTNRSSVAGDKRDAPESSRVGATYASNKRARARKRLDELRKDLDDAEEKTAVAGNEMMQILVFMREDADRRAETEDRRRREDREAQLSAERKEREERELLRREEAVAAEVRRCQEVDEARAIREDQLRKEAKVAAEERLRYEERLERDRVESRERHEQLMLLIATMQRGNQQGSCNL